MRLKATFCSLNIVQIYAPTSAATEEDLDNFYELLEDFLRQERMYYHNGRFNARLIELLLTSIYAILLAHLVWGSAMNVAKSLFPR